MATGFDPEFRPPFSIAAPAQQREPFVLNSPHSGRVYTPELMKNVGLSERAIRKSEDYYVDELFGCGPQIGVPLLSAHFPRAFLDVNREPYELDPTMFVGRLPDFVNTRSVRVAGGLGTIARIVSESEEIYAAKLSQEDAFERIETMYKPYHASLRRLLAETHVRFGYAVLIDCHSMPSARYGTGRGVVRNEVRPDFVIGDRYGNSCAPELMHAIREFLTDLGYRVDCNKPYAGGFITEHYGRPENGLHAVQIEINRALYMDEVRLTKGAGFDMFKGDIRIFLQRLLALPDEGLYGNQPLAAE